MKKTSKQQITYLLVASCVAISTLAPGIAKADRKTVIAAGCKFESSSVPWEAEMGGMFNLSQEMQLLVCPVIRDNTSGYVSDVDVFVKDSSPTEGVLCWMAVEDDRQTGLVATGVKTSASYVGSGREDMDPENISPDIATTHAFYRLYCEIPGITKRGYASGILAYSWNE